MRRHTFARSGGFTLLIALFVLTLPLLGQTTVTSAPRKVLVKFRSLDPQALQRVVEEHDIDRARWVGGTGVILFRSRSKDAGAMVRALAGRADVLYAEPDYVVHKLAEPNDPYYLKGLLWGMTKISAPQAWGVTTGSTGTVVGVVDTGIDYNHPDLTANVWSAPEPFSVTIGGVTINCPKDSHGFNAITNTCDPKDDENHGTHVSGTIGAVGNNSTGVAGVNWNTKIMGLKFLDSTGSGYTSDAVDAIEFAIQMKLKFGLRADVRVLSNSWGGGGYSQALLDEIKSADSNGMLFVAAAGNAGQSNDSRPSYPANYNAPNVVAVAATDSADNMASWSNYGARTVGLAAPGVGIWSTVRSNSYASYSGTSMATPHVSGAAALILSAPGCGKLSTAALKSVILNNVDPVLSVAGKTATNGRLNAGRAVQNCAVTAGFTLSISPASRSVKRGAGTTYTVNVSKDASFKGGTVALAMAGGLPSGATGSFAGSVLTVTTGSSTPLGTFTLLIRGDSGTLVRSTTATLTVTKK
jgi:serine protease